MIASSFGLDSSVDLGSGHDRFGQTRRVTRDRLMAATLPSRRPTQRMTRKTWAACGKSIGIWAVRTVAHDTLFGAAVSSGMLGVLGVLSCRARQPLSRPVINDLTQTLGQRTATDTNSGEVPTTFPRRLR
jgi:hypothetical protein